MLTEGMKGILNDSEKFGWVLEPDAKTLFKLAGLPVPNFKLAATAEDAITAAGEIGYPVAAKAVSPAVVHKTDVDAVALNIDSNEALRTVYDRFARFDQFKGVLVEEMIAAGVELIIGAKMDYQFGPVVLVGIGGTGVELYGDTAVRMAPVTDADVHSMVYQLKGRKALEGFRGSAPVAMDALSDLVIRFSQLIMDLENRFTSIDLNPVMCTSSQCIVADARIMLTETDRD